MASAATTVCRPRGNEPLMRHWFEHKGERERVSHPVNAAALRGGAPHAGDGGPETGRGVGDDGASRRKAPAPSAHAGPLSGRFRLPKARSRDRSPAVPDRWRRAGAPWMTATRACSDVRRGSRTPGRYEPCRRFGTRRFSVPRRVTRARSRSPLREVVRPSARSCRPAPITPPTSVSVTRCSTASAPTRRKPPPSCLSNSSVRLMVIRVIAGCFGDGVASASSTRTVHLAGHPA